MTISKSTLRLVLILTINLSILPLATAQYKTLLWGTTKNNGAHNNGTIFSFDPKSHEYTVRHNLSGMSRYALEPGSEQSLYGIVTSYPGYADHAIFSYNTTLDTFIIEKEFDNNLSTYFPSGTLFHIGDDRFYGVAKGANDNSSGIIYEFDKSADTIKVLASFDSKTGTYPSGKLMKYNDSTYYGVTYYGKQCNSGTLYKFNSNSKQITSVATFGCCFSNETPAFPGCGGNNALTLTKDSLIYGTTSGRMKAGNDMASLNDGSFFIFNPKNNTVQTKIMFADSNYIPNSKVVIDDNGNAYGTTFGHQYSYITRNEMKFGGSFFKFNKQDTSIKTLKYFYSKFPTNMDTYGMVMLESGDAFATTSDGGSGHLGQIFELNSSNGTIKSVFSFTAATGTMVMGLLTPLKTDTTASKVQRMLNAGYTPYQVYLTNNKYLDSLYGKSFGGGLISYLDTGTGLTVIAAPEDLSTELQFGGCNRSTINVPGINNGDIGAGYNNTKLMIESRTCRSGYYSAQDSCWKLKLNGFSDWFLPSKYELKSMCENLYKKGFGNFASETYWSSSVTAINYGWATSIVFPNETCSSIQNLVNTKLKVRPARYVPAATTPSVAITSTDHLTPHSEKISINISSDGGEFIDTVGICYSAQANGTRPKYIKMKMTRPGSYSTLVENLNPGTQYYVWAYCGNGVGTISSDTVSFSTQIKVITSVPDKKMGISVAKVNGTILASSPQITLIETGVCWSTSSTPPTSTSGCLSSSEPSKNFTIGLPQLSPNATYYATAYAKVNDGNSNLYFGNQAKFTTIQNNPISGNYILSEDFVSCNGNFEQIQASQPHGGSGTFTYVWQMNSGQGWNNANGTNNTSNYTPPRGRPNRYHQGVHIPVTRYRRIVNSAGHSDTSSSVTYTLMPIGYPSQPVVKESPGFDQKILSVYLNDPLGPWNIQWQKWKSSNWKPINGATDPDYIVANDELNALYRVTASYGPGCPVNTSATITFSPVDGDSNVYPTVLIGTQLWFTKNLRTTTLPNGTSIPVISGDSSWNSAEGMALSWYNNDSLSNAFEYGALYNYLALEETDQLCPEGWHVATFEDWITLNSYTGGADGRIAGWALKTLPYWHAPNNVSYNTWNFNALPGGMRSETGKFTGLGTLGTWWPLLSEEAQTSYFEMLNVTPENKNIQPSGSNIKKEGHSIRCVRLKP